MKKTWIIPHKAVQSFGWMFLDSFDAFKSVPDYDAGKRECTFLRSPIYTGRKRAIFSLRHLRVSN